MSPYLQRTADISAVSLASLCTLHCLLLPLLILAGPMFGGLILADENFHKILVLITLPMSAIGLYLGCRQHQHLSIAFIGAAGVCTIVLAAFSHTLFHSELLEKTLSVAGSVLIIYAHFKNYQLCQLENCKCGSDHAK